MSAPTFLPTAILTGVAIVHGPQIIVVGASYVTAAILSRTVRETHEAHVREGRPLSGSKA